MENVKVYSVLNQGNKALSTNFKVREFRCKDGSDPVLVHPELVKVLQDIRTHFGRPITINSAFRTPDYNKKVGGERQSQHLYGRAADIVIPGVSPKKVAEYAEKLMPNKGGIGIYPTFTHIDVRSKKARW